MKRLTLDRLTAPLSTASAHNALVLCVALALVAPGCGDDQPIPQDTTGADGTVDGGTDGGGNDIGTDIDAAGPQARLTFSITDGSGPKLIDPSTAVIVKLDQDKYPGLDEPGFQFDVIIAGTNVPDGTEIDVLLDGKSVGKASMTGGAAQLAKLTLPCSSGAQSTIGVSATVAGAAVSANKAILLDCGDGCQASLVAPAGCLSADADAVSPGFQAAFEVTTSTPECTHASLRVTDVNGKVSETQKVALVGGKASVTATLASESTGVVNKTASVVAVVEDQANASRPKGESAAQSVAVTTDPPTVAIVAPDKALLTLADDLDGSAANGVQVALVGTATTLTPSDVEKIVIKVDGVEVGKTTLKLSGGFDHDVTFTTSKTYEVTVEATNACGLVGVGKRSYQVAATKAALTIVSPSSGTVLNGKDDQDPATAAVLDDAFELALQGAADGTKVSIFCRPNQVGTPYPAVAQGSTTVAGGAATLQVPVKVDIGALGTAIVCIARDDGANPSESAEVALTVGLPPPCMTLKLPQAGFVTADATLPVAATATGLEGAVVEATLTLQGGATFIDTPVGKIKNGAFTGSLPLSVGSPPIPVPHGTYTLALRAVDAFGNDVKNGICSTLSQAIAIDHNPPVLTLAIPTKQILDPTIDADSDALSPGYQTKVVFSLAGESEVSTSTVCANVNGFPLPCQTIKGNGQVTFASVTLQPGSNVIVASAKDQLGNASKDVTVNITLQSNAAIVKWLKPATNVFVATDTVDIEVSVTDQALGVPVNGATMALVLNGKEVAGVTFASTGNGTYGAKVTGLQPGANVLQVTALPTGAQTEGVSPQLTVTRKADKPTIALQGFTDGEVVNLAKVGCIGGLTDCITNIAATTVSAANGSTATLVVACDLAATVTTTATVTDSALTFASVALPHGAKCTLSATLVDEAGQSVAAPVLHVSVDRVAPLISAMIPNKLLFVATDDTNANPADGVQASLSVQVSGIPATSDVALTVTGDDGKTAATAKTGSHSAIADGAGTALSLGVVSLPSGKAVKLSFSTADAAGNIGSLVLTVVVVADAPEIRLVSPSSLDGKTCTAQADCGNELCHQGKCTLPWAKNTSKVVGVALLGVLAGAKLRICSDNGNVTGAACAVGGKQVAEATIDPNLSGSVDLKALGDGLHTVTAELLPNGKDAAVASNWVSSTTASIATTRKRLILVDSVAPKLVSVLAPAPAGVPATCLARLSQVASDGGAPGGTFNFAVTTEAEEATVSLLAAGSTIGTVTTKSKIGALTAKIGAEGSVALTAIAKDAVGNESAPLVLGTFEVNTIPPIGQFAAPTKGTLIAGDSLDVRVASPSTDVEGQPVALKDGDKTIGSVAMSKGEAAFAHSLYQTLTDGSHTLTAVISDSCANTATISTSPAIVTVDTKAPTASFSAPTEAQAFGDANDAKADVGGYQVAVTFGTAGAKTWKLELGTDCDAQFANCAGFAQVGGADVSADGGSEPTVFVTVPFGKTKQYSLRLTASDASGNATVVSRGFLVDLSGCLLSLSGLPASGIVNTTNCATAGQNCASVKLPLQVGYVGPCGNVSAVQLLVDGKEAANTAPANNAATLELTVLDGSKPKVEVKVLEGTTAKATTGESSLTVDLTLPVASFIAGTVLGESTPAGSATALLGKASDRDPAKNGHQVHLLLQVVDAGLKGGKVTAVKETVSGSDLSTVLGLPTTFASDGTATAELKFVTVKEDASNAVEAAVSDAAGNTAKATIAIDVDWVAPAAVVLEAFGAGDLNPRRPFAKLDFKAVAEDGTTGGAAAKYEVAYSRSAIADTAGFEAACKASALPKTAIPTPATPGTAQTIVVEGPDGRAAEDSCKFATLTDNGVTKYTFAVRAVDAAGNIGPISNVLTTEALRLRYAKWSSTTAPWNQAYGYAYMTFVGDVNGDGLGDVLLGGRNGAKACLVYGHANADLTVPDLDIKTQAAATHTCFDNAVALGMQAAGIDANGDGIGDVVLSFGQGTNVKREVHVYLGEKGKPLTTTPALKITNITFNVVAGIRALTSAGNMNGDVSAGSKPIQDFAFTVTATSTVLEERVFVVPGSASWSTAAPKTFDIESATARAENNVLLIKRSDYAGTPAFGIGLGGGGNILRDSGTDAKQFDDLMIVQNAGTQGVYIVRGRAWTGATTISLSNNLDSGSADDKSAVVLRPGFTGINTFQSPVFVEYDGDSIPDVAVAHSPANDTTYLHWASGKAINEVGAGLVPLNASLLPGQTDFYKTNHGFAKVAPVQFIYAAGDFGDVGDGSTGIVSIRPTWASGGRVNIGVRSALTRSGGAAGAARSYEVEDLAIANVFAPGSTTMGNFTVASDADFNGDGFEDLVVGTYSSGMAILVY